MILISVYIVTRSGVLVYVSKNKKKNKGYYIDENDEDEKKEDDTINCNWDSKQVKTFCYDDVILFLLFNLNGIRDLLIIKIDIKYIKEH